MLEEIKSLSIKLLGGKGGKEVYINPKPLANISSKDLEGEIVDMVDRNFWDLI
jgi:hypothetical protein